jgi:hypothetical protein
MASSESWYGVKPPLTRHSTSPILAMGRQMARAPWRRKRDCNPAER